jgi:hypothetical protein
MEASIRQWTEVVNEHYSIELPDQLRIWIFSIEVALLEAALCCVSETQRPLTVFPSIRSRTPYAKVSHNDMIEWTLIGRRKRTSNQLLRIYILFGDSY